ncbi:antibiotic biosynthesis monooxygenase [Streptomyces sp. SID12501]|uniref:Antibiotic biosynthesis monooxygenase n=2 Tax=Streptomyces sp. SID12501 TaxID=2706042 RepID=A0A6B3BUI0_9ACTN|nr:antibiotic biosynthesis monooxygenase [Streptomyces sp. SID12501]NEC87958.1 antibiotic biosynthesis monooxygenase [Streptomyces sp. SID12501]
MLRMQIKPGMEADFERMWKEVGGSVTSHPANRGQWLSRSTTVDEDDIYYIISDWVDEPQFRQFETSDTHLQHRTRLHPYRSGGSMATMNIVAMLSRTAA